MTLTACGSSPPPPAKNNPAPPAQELSYNANVDLEIAHMYDGALSPKRIPQKITWSPDGSSLAYLSVSELSTSETNRELWIYEMATQYELPLVSDPKMPVTDYQWCAADRLVVSSAGDLFEVDLEGEISSLTNTDAVEHSAIPSPDCTKIAFVREHNLFVLNLNTGVEKQLTRGGTLEHSFGEVTWMYGEEFNTKAGMGWSPDGEKLWIYATSTPAATVHVIADDSRHRQAYPKPGEPNPTVHVGIITPSHPNPRISWLHTGEETDVYLPQVTWHPDSKRLLITRLDRLQTILSLLICDAKTKQCQTVVEERDPRWVNLPQRPTFIQNGYGFLWLSERSGFSHIYRFGIDGSLEDQITKGNWTVTSIDAVDEEHGKVFFTANAKHPYSYEIFASSKEEEEMAKISQQPGVHETLFSPNGDYFVDTHSTLNAPAQTTIHHSSGALISRLSKTHLKEYSPPQVMNDIFPIETENGQTLFALLTRPVVIDQHRRYPVLVYVYGGPGKQVVKNEFGSMFQPWRNLMAKRGVLVFSVDGRGSGGRGREFEMAIHRQLGKVELADQLAGLEYLKSLPFVDQNRIGIFGWSYGGTMALNAVMRTKNIFKLGIAVAPVTDWRQYDSAYTERYMQRPIDNEQGYKNASVLSVVDGLNAPLLLIHGVADDNVHFVHSRLLLNALISAGKYFEVMFYPGKDHRISGVKTRTDLFTRITRFIETHL
ncbi:MAG: prolyl oligopeptidase family serine peptidase [Proteobacteria bacterium]|nr:prolyl oligopeptidase family serine peptidase [Pseudomonadota bacterium]